MSRRQDPQPGGRLTIERYGHQVTADARGLSIDGHVVDRTVLSQADAVPVRPSGAGDFAALQVLPEGEVVYRGRLQAQLHPSPPGTANPGQVEVYGPTGQRWPPRAEPGCVQPPRHGPRERAPQTRQQRRAAEEADRLRREDHLLTQRELQTYGREITR